MGMFNVPDMHTAVLQRPDKSYLLWITGNIGPSGSSIAMLSTKDFLTYLFAELRRRLRWRQFSHHRKKWQGPAHVL
jgi:hypothetical protein